MLHDDDVQRCCQLIFSPQTPPMRLALFYSPPPLLHALCWRRVFDGAGAIFAALATVTILHRLHRRSLPPPSPAAALMSD